MEGLIIIIAITGISIYALRRVYVVEDRIDGIEKKIEAIEKKLELNVKE